MARINSPTGNLNTLSGVSWPTDGGDIDLEAGNNCVYTPDNITKKIRLDVTGGAASGMTTVNTVALLKVATGVSDGEYRYLGGYYAPGDGGGGEVIRNTSLSSFNEGTKFDHNTEAGGWERVE